MQNLNNFVCYFAYAAGFATGTFVGIIIEEKLAIGTLVIRVIVDKNECELKERLSKSGFGVTVVIIKRKELQEVVRIIEKPFIQLKMPERSIRVFSGQVRQTMMGQGF